MKKLVLSCDLEVDKGWRDLAKHIMRLVSVNHLSHVWIGLDSPSHRKPLLQALANEIQSTFLPCQFLDWPSMTREQSFQWQISLYMLLKQQHIDGLSSPASLMQVIRKNMAIFEELILHYYPDVSLSSSWGKQKKELWLLAQIEQILREEHPYQTFLDALLNDVHNQKNPIIICVGERWKNMLHWFELAFKKEAHTDLPIYQVIWQGWPDKQWDNVSEEENSFNAISLIKDSTLEGQAQQAFRKIKQWIDQDIKQIAIIPNDRLLARRLQAILFRFGLVVRDDQGWPLTLFRESFPLLAWFDFLSQRSFVSLVHFFKNSLVLMNVPKAKRLLIEQLDIRLSQAHFDEVSDIDTLILSLKNDLLPQLDLCEWHEVEVLLQQIKNWFNIQQIDSAIETTRLWWRDSHLSFALANSEVGLNINACFEETFFCLENFKSAPIALNDWVLLLRQSLEHTFLPSHRTRLWDQQELAQSTQIYFSSLLALSRVKTEAVVVLGAGINQDGTVREDDKEQLMTQFKMANHLDFVSRWEPKKNQEQKNIWANLLRYACQKMSLVWISDDNQEPLSGLSPHWVSMIDTVDLSSIIDVDHKNLLKENQLQENVQLMNRWVKPSLMIQEKDHCLLPAAINVTQLSLLMDCPFRFVVESFFGVKPKRQMNMLDAAVYGQLLHQILQRFHELENNHQTTVVGEYSLLWQQACEENLIQYTEKIFQKSAQLFHQIYWKIRLDLLFEPYLKWYLEQKNQGWSVLQHEKSMVYQGDWSVDKTDNKGNKASLPFLIKGRIDRLDVGVKNGKNVYRIIDYKTRAPHALQAMREHDIQLPFYAWLQKTEDISWLSLQQEQVSQVGFYKKNSLFDVDQEISNLIEHDLKSLAMGKMVDINAQSSVCQYCQKYSMCRSDLSRELS